MRINPLIEKDEELLDKASKSFNIGKYGDFLVKWANALESYGTPRDFVYDTYYEAHNINIKNETYPFIFVIAPGNERRREYVAKQKTYMPRNSLDSYGVRLDKDISDCFLCENVIQGIDANNYPEEVGDNVILDLGTHYILPNRYPAEYGHSLSVQKNHDVMTNRVIPKEKTALFKPELSKTRGNILTSDYLEALIEACDKYYFVGLRNHSLEGMSLYKHEHFHIFLEVSKRFREMNRVLGTQGITGFGSNIYLATNTPFDTLLITKEKSKQISDFAIPLLRKMEEDNQIFTLIYNNNTLFVSPRKAKKFDDKRQQVGACMPIHAVDVSVKETNQRIKFMPLKGEFTWDKYAP